MLKKSHIFLLHCCLFLVTFCSSVVVRADQLFYFDIPAQRTDLAIISMAKQINQTIVFSYALTKNYRANAVKGYYTAQQGLHKLLYDSGLEESVNAQGQFSIQLASKPVQNSKKKVIKPKVQVTDTDFVDNVIESPIEKIAIVGSRNSGRTATDLPVPVDILTSTDLLKTGQTELGRMIQTLAPSFNFSSSAISDGTDSLRPATLRGLGPDQTLILINGKRRHQASLIHINSSVGRGTAGTDINAIPPEAIKRIEILRDGAAAQYGSDAIAGVINIVLKDEASPNSFQISSGITQQGDGATQKLSLNNSFKPLPKADITATIGYRKRGYTDRSGEHGSCQFDQCVLLSNGHWQTSDNREINASRHTFRIGDAESEQLTAVINGQYHQSESKKFYGFATFSNRKNQSSAFFREYANQQANPILLDNQGVSLTGYLPKINSTIRDYSIDVGYKSTLNSGGIIDFSYTYGKNSIDYTTQDSINASYANYLQYQQKLTPNNIRQTIPRSAHAYGLALSLSTLNLDFSQDFDLENSVLALAFGAEIRRDQFNVFAGEQYAYVDYDTQNGQSLFEQETFGFNTIDAEGGIQGFPGISPESEVNESRNIYSVYIDAETELTERLFINAALRYDKFAQFGQSTTYKIAASWMLDDDFSLRSAFNSGVRAPSMQQLYFNNVSTQFVVNEQGQLAAEQIGTFRNDSTLAQLIGIPKLTEEKSSNWSLGIAGSLNQHIKVSLDYYAIDIKNRIVISNRLGKGLSPELDAALNQAQAGKGQFFLNGANTTTHGVDVVASWGHPLLSGQIEHTFVANFSHTKVSQLFTPDDSSLTTVPVELVFAEQDISIIEQWQPSYRIGLLNSYQKERLTLTLGFNLYGDYTVKDGGEQTYGRELITDINFNYQLNQSLALKLGINNLFNTTPDKNKIGNSHAGVIEDSNGNILVQSDGVFVYSRRSAPFGYNGLYGFAGIEYNF